MRDLTVTSSCIIFPNGVTVYGLSAVLYSNMVFFRNERGMSVADIDLGALGVTADGMFAAMTGAGFQVEDKRENRPTDFLEFLDINDENEIDIAAAQEDLEARQLESYTKGKGA